MHKFAKPVRKVAQRAENKSMSGQAPVADRPVTVTGQATEHGARVAPPGGWRATFLVVCYRMKDTVLEAVEGALAQTVACEIIVSDDSSCAETLPLVRDRLRDYAGPHRVIVRSTASNIGLCAHLNELAAIATAPVLFNSAGDDVSLPERVDTLLRVFDAEPDAQIVGSCVDDVDAQGRLIEAGVRGLPARVDQRWLINRGKLATILGASMAFRTTLLTDLPPLEGRVEDNMLMLRGALIGVCRCLPVSLIRYRRHDHNLGDWVFDRSERGYEGWKRRQLRVAEMYVEIADDQLRCIEARPDLPSHRRQAGQALQALYRLEALQRVTMIEQPRSRWIAPLMQGLKTRGLRRKSAERALKLLLPRKQFGR